MQIKRTEKGEKPKGIIERNQNVNKLNNDTLENKVDASLKHTAEAGLKTSGSNIVEESDGRSKYTAAYQARLMNERSADAKTENSEYDDYYKNHINEHTEEKETSLSDEIKPNSNISNKFEETISQTPSSGMRDTAREQFLHNKQINTAEKKNKPRNNKEVDLTEYEVTSGDKTISLYQQDFDRRAKKLIEKGKNENRTGRKIQTAQNNAVADKSDLSRVEHENIKEYKYYRNPNGRIQSKVEYNKRLYKKLSPTSSALQTGIDNQRKTKNPAAPQTPKSTSSNIFFKNSKGKKGFFPFLYNRSKNGSAVDNIGKKINNNEPKIVERNYEQTSKPVELKSSELPKRESGVKTKADYNSTIVDSAKPREIQNKAKDDIIPISNSDENRTSLSSKSESRIKTKVEYNKTIANKVEPRGISNKVDRSAVSERKIINRNNELVRSFEKDSVAWENYKNNPNKKTATLYRKTHGNYIGVLKSTYSPEELKEGKFVEFGNKKVRVVTKVNFDGNIEALKKTVKVDKKTFAKLRAHLRFKKISKAASSVIGKVVGSGIVSLPKYTLRSGVNYINTKAKSINTEDTTDTGIESAKLMYKSASEGRQLATSVKSGIKTSTKAVKGTYRMARDIPGKVKNIPKTARRIATSVGKTPYTAKKAVSTSAKRSAKTAKQVAQQAKKAAKRVAEAAQKSAKAIEKAVEVTFKAMAKASAFFVTHLPIILIVALILLVVILVVMVITSLVSVVSGTTTAGVGYVFPEKETEPEDVAEILDQYKSSIENGLEMVKDNNIEQANSFLSADDDFYAAFTDHAGGDWIGYNEGSGEESVRTILENIEVDYAEFYALLYVYMQKQKNEEDGNQNADIYSFAFTDSDLKDFIDKYFDITYTEQSGLECPGKSCKIEHHDPGCQTRIINVTIGTPDGPINGTKSVPYCPGHPYCDHHHKKAIITIVKNDNVMDDLGFTDNEKQWEGLVEMLYEDYIMGNVLNGIEVS